MEVSRGRPHARERRATSSLLDGAGLLVKSPGVPGEAALVAAARERGIPVWSEIELGYRLLGARLVAVTGTNGKTTTSELLGAMLGAPVAGNVGRALTELDGAVEPGALVVCEVSSFQLEDVHEFRPAVAVLLNLEPDHLDRHGSFEAYRDAKLRLFENQRPEDTAVVPRGFGAVPGAARRVEFRWDDPLPAEPLIPGRTTARTPPPRRPPPAPPAPGRTDRGGAARPSRASRTASSRCASCTACCCVNDSKATNVAAARRGVAAYADRPLRLIVGGSRKGEDFAPLAAALGPNVRAVYAIGETAGELPAAIPPALGARRTSRTAVRRAAARRRARRRRPALARVRELRPVPRLRGPRRRVPPARRRLVLRTDAGRTPTVAERSGAGPVELGGNAQGQLESQLLILITLGLVAFGLVMVYQATSAPAALGNGDPMHYLKRQAVYAVIGLVAMVVASPHAVPPPARARADARRRAASRCSRRCSSSARRVNGARRWIGAGPLAFQPSELAKLAIAVWGANYLARKAPPKTLGELARPIGLLVAVFCAPAPARARPRDDDRARRWCSPGCSSSRARRPGRSSRAPASR